VAGSVHATPICLFKHDLVSKEDEAVLRQNAEVEPCGYKASKCNKAGLHV